MHTTIERAPEHHLTAETVKQTAVSRRQLIGMTVLSTLSVGLSSMSHAQNLSMPSWTTSPGFPVAKTPYGLPSRFQSGFERKTLPGLSPVPENSASFTPLQGLLGIITPSGVHYERHHSGWPDIDPESIDCLSQAQTRVSYRSPRYLLSKIYSAYPAYRGFTSSNAAETQERNVYEQQRPRCSTHMVYCHALNSQVFPLECCSKVVVPT